MTEETEFYTCSKCKQDACINRKENEYNCYFEEPEGNDENYGIYCRNIVEDEKCDNCRHSSEDDYVCTVVEY